MNLEDMLFHDWEGIVQTIVVGTLSYVSLVLFLRISSKRTIAKLKGPLQIRSVWDQAAVAMTEE